MSDGNDWESSVPEPIKLVAHPLLVDKWEGEDEDDEVKDNWDDEEEEEEGEKKEQTEQINQEIKAVQVKKKKIRQEKIAKKNKEAEEKILKQVQLTPNEELEEKLKQRQLVEESDLQLAKEAFGINDTEKCGIDAMYPSSKEDFEEFENSLREKIVTYEKSIHYIPFLESLFRGLCAGLETEEIKKLGSSLNFLSIEKSKQLKAKAKKKNKKATLVVDRGNNFDYGDYGADEFDDFM